MAALGSAQVTTTGTVISAGVNIHALQWRSGSTAGSIVLRDGGASGTVLATLNTDAGSSEKSLSFGDSYLAFGTDVHATLTNADALTVFYG